MDPIGVSIFMGVSGLALLGTVIAIKLSNGVVVNKTSPATTKTEQISVVFKSRRGRVHTGTLLGEDDRWAYIHIDGQPHYLWVMVPLKRIKFPNEKAGELKSLPALSF
ncbi:hypothetical protein C4553_03390 [Candidatus Parcubacteria bacterium]|nr:MAG: hypothetical protein C4553_03390 [Candidatus Parcubacteria bacterium]